MAEIDGIKYILNPIDMLQTSSQIDESGENIKEEYNELMEADEALSAELNGSVSTDFSNAVNRIESDLKTIYYKFIETSETMTHFTRIMQNIDTNAEHLAGGNQNE